MRRRRFLRVVGAGAAGSLFLPEWLEGAEATSGRGPHREGAAFSDSLSSLPVNSDETHLVILHTNDTHSRMDPFPMDGGPFQGLGGAARRATLIKRVRARHPNVLLLDSGDIFQGTPYFNFFRGEIEFEAMSAMDYDVATIGNHDFDNGVDGLVEMMPRATFDFVSANYDVTDSPLESRVRPWIIREVGGVGVGIFGLGIEFDGLVLESLHRGVRYIDPFAVARRCVSELRNRGCSLLICLSHLGYRYRGDRPSDTLLAQEVEGIDLILGGHTHTFMDEPDVYPQPGGRRTLVNQVGWAGMRLGRVDVVMEPAKRRTSGALHQPGCRADAQDLPVRRADAHDFPTTRHLPVRWAAGGYSVDAALD